MLKEVNQSKWFRQVPDIPILLLSGDRDPVGSFGKGVKKVYRRLLKTGHRVQLALYPGGRHEMLNETNKGEVYETISGFLSKALENSSN